MGCEKKCGKTELKRDRRLAVAGRKRNCANVWDKSLVSQKAGEARARQESILLTYDYP